MEQEEINEHIIASVTRAMFHEQEQAYPFEYARLWSALSEDKKQVVRNKAIQWLVELKRVSPKTFEFIENNYAEVHYR